MTHSFDIHLNLLTNTGLLPELSRINRGIEKEGLRATSQGQLSQRPHPKTLGSALAHPHITTDYSEALLEFITPVHQSAGQALEFLRDIHSFAYSQLDDELIWCASMPCFLGGEDSIPIARYGTSNIGKLKHIYRVGLAYRYGKMMQTIAGIHYNFSLADSFWPAYQDAVGNSSDLQTFRTDQYFALIRNFNRYSWLLLYLFGASPALCPCFLQGQAHDLKRLSDHTLYKPYATSLRMGDMGYHNSTQKQLDVCYNSLEQYVKSLGTAINTPHPPYEAIGVLNDGEYRQLSTNILQIENEYYSDIRPKRITPSGQKPLNVLAANGVEYIEVRNLDINPFMLVGIDELQMRFLDCFLLYCLLEDSPIISNSECGIISENKDKVVNQGRQPGLKLLTESGPQPLIDVANRLFGRLQAVAEILDKAQGGHMHCDAVLLQKDKLASPDSTPSARILDSLHNNSYFDFCMERAVAIREQIKTAELNEQQIRYFTQLAETSLAQQRKIEKNDAIPFDEFLEQYLTQ